MLQYIIILAVIVLIVYMYWGTNNYTSIGPYWSGRWNPPWSSDPTKQRNFSGCGCGH
jgi:hypothetical protein